MGQKCCKCTLPPPPPTCSFITSGLGKCEPKDDCANQVKCDLLCGVAAGLGKCEKVMLPSGLCSMDEECCKCVLEPPPPPISCMEAGGMCKKNNECKKKDNCFKITDPNLEPCPNANEVCCQCFEQPVTQCSDIPFSACAANCGTGSGECEKVCDKFTMPPGPVPTPHQCDAKGGGGELCPGTDVCCTCGTKKGGGSG